MIELSDWFDSESRRYHSSQKLFEVDGAIRIEIQFQENTIDLFVLNRFTKFREAFFEVNGSEFQFFFCVKKIKKFSDLLLGIVIEGVPTNKGYKLVDIVKHFVLFLEEGDWVFFELFFIVEDTFAFEDEEKVGRFDT